MVEKQRMGALAVCRAALRALVKMLLKHGVMHRELVELSKEIYVDVARRDYGIRGRPTNVARMALLTGLDRKEITRIKKKLDDQRPATRRATQRRSANRDRISRVLSGWHQDPDYVGADGKPRLLSLEGPAPSYADLVKRYGGDVPPSTILRELKRTGAVTSRRAATARSPASQLSPRHRRARSAGPSGERARRHRPHRDAQSLSRRSRSRVASKPGLRT